MFLNICILVVVAMPTVKALDCWRCDNAISNADCLTRGRLETCTSHEDTCQSVLRQENGMTFISKQCKQTQACHNSLNDNEKRCNTQSDNSLCTCCCNTDSCNTGMLDCFDQDILGTQSCPIIRSTLPHGKMECSEDSNKPGSVCQFQCTEDKYEVYPNASERLECLPTGQWSKPEPCCALPCPPYVLFDVLVMIHASSNKTFMEIAKVGRMGYSNLIVSPEIGNMYAHMEFSGNVHDIGIITFNDTLTATFSFEREPYMNTADGKVNIGNAMNWALDNMMGPGTGDRARVRDILLIGTDSASDDDVTEAVRNWKGREALIYIMVFPNDDGKFHQYDKLLEITQNPNHIYYFEPGKLDSTKKIFDDTIKHFCSNICNHVLHDHE